MCVNASEREKERKKERKRVKVRVDIGNVCWQDYKILTFQCNNMEEKEKNKEVSSSMTSAARVLKMDKRSYCRRPVLNLFYSREISVTRLGDF